MYRLAAARPATAAAWLSSGRPSSADSRRGENAGHGAQSQRHADRSGQQQRLATRAIDERDGGDGCQNVDETGEEIDAQGPLLRRPDCLPQHLTVIEDDVDADELLEGGQPDRRPRRPAQAAACSYEQVRQARPVLAAQALLRPAAPCSSAVAADPSEDAPGVVRACRWATRKRGDSGMSRTPTRKAIGGHGLHPEHPAPSRRAQPEGRGRAAGGPGDDVVAQEGAEQAQHDGHLLQRGQSAAQVCGGHLRDVHRGQHAGGTDGQPAQEARGDEDHGRSRHAGGDALHRKSTALRSMVGRRP